MSSSILSHHEDPTSDVASMSSNLPISPDGPTSEEASQSFNLPKSQNSLSKVASQLSESGEEHEFDYDNPFTPTEHEYEEQPLFPNAPPPASINTKESSGGGQFQ